MKFKVTRYVELKDEKYCNGCQFLNLDWEGYTYSWCHLIKRIKKDEFGLQTPRPKECPLERITDE